MIGIFYMLVVPVSAVAGQSQQNQDRKEKQNGVPVLVHESPSQNTQG